MLSVSSVCGNFCRFCVFYTGFTSVLPRIYSVARALLCYAPETKPLQRKPEMPLFLIPFVILACNTRMIRKTLFGSLIAVSLVASSAKASDWGGLAGGVAGGIISGVIQAAANRQPKTVVVEKTKTVVVHDHAAKPVAHHTKPLPTMTSAPAVIVAATPTLPPVAMASATLAPTPVATPAPVVAATPAPTPVKPADSELRTVANQGPTTAYTSPVLIDHPKDMNEQEMALLSNKAAVMAYFDNFFKRTSPLFSVADSSLFMEVQIGAYNFLVAKIAMNRPAEAGGSTIEQGFVIDLKNEYATVVNMENYHEFMHTGNITLLGEKHLNPLD